MSLWSLVFRPSAVRELRNLAPGVADRTISAMELYADSERGDVMKLKGGDDQYRLRVGEWRVIFERDRDTRTLFVLHVRHRREAYR